MNNQPISPIDALLDENNNDNICLYNENGKAIEFAQIALIPLSNKTYAILKPTVPIEGVGEDEGLVFGIERSIENGQEYLSLITDEKIIDDVFTIFDRLVSEENN